jgi:hypothetical protein
MASFIAGNALSARFRHSRWVVTILLAALIAFVGWFLAVAPLFIAFVGVVAGACGWCLWLERHTEHRGQ